MLKRLVVPVLIGVTLLLAAALVAAPLVALQAGRSALDAGNLPSAQTHFTTASRLTVFQRWIPLFDRGIARYHLEQWDASASDFEAASKLAPADRQCDIRLSWAAALESGGDMFIDRDDIDSAMIRYQQAQIVLAAANCQATGSPTASDAAEDQWQQSRRRLEEKVTNGAPATSLGSESSAELDPEQELQQRQQQAQQQRQQAEDRSQAGTGGGGEKTW